MENIRQQALLIYDLFTFNFDIENPNATGEILLEREGLGADLPAELFPQILYWLKHSDNRRQIQRLHFRHYEELSDWEIINFRNQLNMANPLFALRNCALVSRYWANRCREYMFKGATLHFRTLDEARVFRRYATQGSPNLIPLYELIGEILVTQDYSGIKRSFLDLVYTSRVRDKLKLLKITGPLPHDSTPLKFDSPHWGIVNTALLPPAATAYSIVSLEGLRFPSFSYAMRYLHYLRGASRLQLKLRSIDWDGKVLDSEPLTLPRPKPIPPRNRVSIYASGGTDSYLLAWYASTMYSDSPIHTVVSCHQRWILRMVNFVYEHYRKLGIESDSEYVNFAHGIRKDCGLPELRLDLERHIYLEASFIFDSRPPTPGVTSRGSPRPMRIIATIIQVVGKSQNDNGVIFTYLRRQLEELHALRIVIFTFPSYKTLLRVTEQIVTLREPWGNVACMYRFVCKDHPDDPILLNPYRRSMFGSTKPEHLLYDDVWEIIPTTLELTGNSAQRLDDLVTMLISR